MLHFLVKQYQEIQDRGFTEFLRKIKLTFVIISRIFKNIFVPTYRIIKYPLLKFYQLLTPLVYLEDITNYFKRASVKSQKINKGKKQNSSDKSVIVYTRVWGKFINYYDFILMRSLFQSGNLLALLEDGYRVTLSVHILKSDVDEVNNIIYKYKNKLIDRHSNLLIIDVLQYDNVINIKEYSLINNIKKCISIPSPCIMAAPDTFFGNFSLLNIIKINMGRNLCIAALHFRVNDVEFLELLDKNVNDEKIPNPRLVTLALLSPHQTLRDSFIEKENCSFLTGLTVVRISNKSYAATFRAPTIYLANYNLDDLKYFSSRPYTANTDYDHEWPTNLMVEGRYKCIGSSDVFFAAELTEPKSHILIHNSEVGNDEHDHSVLHKELHRNFLVIVTSSEHIEACTEAEKDLHQESQT